MTDEELIEQYLNGDEQSLRLLIEQNLEMMYRFVYRYVQKKEEAEDIVQNVFVKVWKNLKRFDQNQSFKNWICTIAKNESLNWLKKKRTIPFSEFENELGENILLESLPDKKPLPDETFEHTEQKLKLAFATAKLNHDQQETLRLYYAGGLNFREIAEHLNASLDTIKSRHRRALTKLKKLLTD